MSNKQKIIKRNIIEIEHLLFLLIDGWIEEFIFQGNCTLGLALGEDVAGTHHERDQRRLESRAICTLEIYAFFITYCMLFIDVKAITLGEFFI